MTTLLFKATLGFYGYDELRERHIAAENIAVVETYVAKRWPTAEIKDVEFIDVLFGEAKDNTDERADIIENLRGIHEV